VPIVLAPESLAPARGYSNGLLYPPGGRLLFIAGQIGWDARGELVSPDFAAQFAQALRNVADVLAEAGGRPEDVGRMTIYVTDKRAYLDALEPVGAAYREAMGTHYPAMTLVEVKDLLEEGAMVEIEATAVVPSEGGPA
jgi:enamine deaminase RidA (YjgF/YER057c/UK114 family)